METIVSLTKQICGVSRRLEELSADLGDNNKMYEDMFYDELIFLQKLVIELTKATAGDEEKTEEEVVEAVDNADSAFMPGELNDVIGEEEKAE